MPERERARITVIVQDLVERVWSTARDRIQVGADNIAAVGGRIRWRRLSVEQTVWAMAINGLVLTPAMRTVLDRAVAGWSESFPEDEPEDRELCEAVIAYVEECNKIRAEVATW